MHTTHPRQYEHLDEVLRRLIAAAPTETGGRGSRIALDTLGDEPLARAYARAMVELLAVLGALHIEPSGLHARVVSVQAGYVLHMFSSLIQARLPLISDWKRVGVASASHSLRSAVDLLATLEQCRLEHLPNAEPLRQTHAAVGLITHRSVDEGYLYLLHWDEHAEMWQLIGGRFEDTDGTMRATMLRELAEELDCQPLSDSAVTLIELGDPFSVERVSPTYGLLTRTVFHAYAVRFLGSMPELPANVRWISEAELLAGSTADGQPISAEPFRRILERPDFTHDLLIS